MKQELEKPQQAVTAAKNALENTAPFDKLAKKYESELNGKEFLKISDDFNQRPNKGKLTDKDLEHLYLLLRQNNAKDYTLIRLTGFTNSISPESEERLHNILSTRINNLDIIAKEVDEALLGPGNFMEERKAQELSEETDQPRGFLALVGASLRSWFNRRFANDRRTQNQIQSAGEALLEKGVHFSGVPPLTSLGDLAHTAPAQQKGQELYR